MSARHALDLQRGYLLFRKTKFEQHRLGVLPHFGCRRGHLRNTALKARRWAGLHEAVNLHKGLTLKGMRVCGRLLQTQHRGETHIGALQQGGPLVSGPLRDSLREKNTVEWIGGSLLTPVMHIHRLNLRHVLWMSIP